ncbi:AraC family transcriptional regulator [Thalassospira sp. SM2505]
MNKLHAQRSYQDRLTRVQAYIHDHLADDLDLNSLAEIACMSPTHWHRIYHGVFGETVAATVKRVRLHTAAGMLANSEIPIDDIAKRCGYPNLQSFTRIFSDSYGMPPARYRKEGSHRKFQNAVDEDQGALVSGPWDVEIRNVPEMSLLTIHHHGSFMQIGEAFDRLFGWLAVRGLVGPDIRLIGVYHTDPDAYREEDLFSRAGVLLENSQAVDVEVPVTRATVAAGRYACLRYKGPYADMRAAYLWLFGKWLPQSGEEVREGPVFEEYLNNPREVAPTELLTEIYMPLEG